MKFEYKKKNNSSQENEFENVVREMETIIFFLKLNVLGNLSPQR